MKTTILASCILAVAPAFCGPGRVFPQVKPADEARLAQLVAEWPAAAAAKPRKILVCNYLRGCEWHGPSVSYGTRLFALASVKGGYTVDFTDIRQLAIKGLLDGYDAVVLNNTTNFQEAEAPGVSENLLAYVSNGGGLLLVHSAVDAFNDSPSVQEMNGGLFWAHPWTAGGGDWCFRNEEPDHPLVASFKSLPTIFHLGDEIYMHPTPPLRPLQGARAHLALPRRREHRRRDEPVHQEARRGQGPRRPRLRRLLVPPLGQGPRVLHHLRPRHARLARSRAPLPHPRRPPVRHRRREGGRLPAHRQEVSAP